MSVYFLTEWLKSIFLVKVLCYKPSRLFLAESDRRGLIFSSRKPAAKEYRKWVCEEVLPSIRKTGRYSLGEEIAPPQSSLAESEAKLTRAQQLALWAQQLADAEQLQLQQQQQRRINPGR